MPHINLTSQNQKPSLSARSLVALPLVALLHACSADVVNMGENPAPEPELSATSLCRESTTLTGEVSVRNQEQLNELEGCEEIDGRLLVVPFAGADLRPLHALTLVEESIYLGYNDEVNGREINRIESLQKSGWLASLEGLESLEQAKSLMITGLAAADLEPLTNLRSLTNFHISECPNLSDLQGLENLRGLSYLDVSCENLETIAPLRLPAEMVGLAFTRSKLSELGSLEVEYIFGDLIIAGTPLEDLDAFSGLLRVSGGILVTSNDSLENMDGLNALQRAGALHVRNNAQLQRMPELRSLSRLETLMVVDNPRLVELSELRILGFELEDELTATEPWQGPRAPRITIMDNPEVLRFAMPVSLRHGERVTIKNNTKLTEVDFGQLESIDRLWIENNPALANVNLNALSSVDVLTVLENPLLQGPSFDNVRTVEREMSGNATP